MRIHVCVTLLSEKTTFGYFALKNFKKLSVSVWNYIIPTNRNKNKLVIDRDKLESTKRAFFIKGQIFFIIV